MNLAKTIKTVDKDAYATGFVVSLILTISAWLLVRHHVQTHHLFWTDKAIVITIVFLAIIQLFVQLTFFLHLFNESKPRWNLTVLGLALTTLLILVLGSLWIMYNLGYHHPHNVLSPEELNHSIIKDEGVQP
jgi:cytochrome o ubiquinol oxidase operon protein cyoD